MSLVAGALVALPAQAVKRRAFATSVTGSGNLSFWPGATGATALDKADSICRARAAVAGLPNANSYRAWISSSTTDAYCHVQGLAGTKNGGCGGASLPGGGPWYLVNGITPFTASLDQLVSPPYAIYRPVILDENLDEIVEGPLLTGTFYSGTGVPSASCLDWTSASSANHQSGGSTSSSGYQWSGNVIVTCDQPHHLLCFEPGPSEAVAVRWTPGAIAFVSSATGNGNLSSWPQANGLSGLDAGDRVCRNLAAAAGLPAPDSFVAWLSAGLVSAIGRLTTNGPFRRVDGFAIANTLADLGGGASMNSLHVDEHGKYLFEAGRTWTGTGGNGLGVGATCLGWTDTSLPGRIGFATKARTGLWTDSSDQPCDQSYHLYCFSNRITLFWDGFELTGDTGRWSSTAP